MADSLDNMVRVIRNVYNAVFETAEIKKSNTVYRYSVTSQSGILVSEDAALLRDVTGLYARAYTALENSGDPYDAEDGLISGVEVKIPDKSVAPIAQGWIFFKFTPSWAGGSPPHTTPYLFSNQPLSTVGWNIRYESGAWTLNYVVTTPESASVAYTHAADEQITVAASWAHPGDLKVWVNAIAPDTHTITKALIPEIDDHHIGWSGIDPGNELEATVQQVVAGIGTLTDDIVLALRDMPADATIYDIPEPVTTLPSFLWNGASLEHEPFGIYGESLYGP